MTAVQGVPERAGALQAAAAAQYGSSPEAPGGIAGRVAAIEARTSITSQPGSESSAYRRR